MDLAAERGPHWGKGPKGYTRSDERTREDVCDAIARQGHIDATDVDVKVENGTVTLSGTVALRVHELSLERLVKRCLGVRDVRSDLRLIRLAIGVLLMFGVMACRQGDPAIDPKTPANSPVPTRLERPDDGPASPSMPRLVPDGGGAAR